jgi:hypothetical protein
MGALCSGGAKNPTTLERPMGDLKVKSKSVSFSDPLTVTEPERLRSPSPSKAKDAEANTLSEEKPIVNDPAGPASGHPIPAEIVLTAVAVEEVQVKVTKAERKRSSSSSSSDSSPKRHQNTADEMSRQAEIAAEQLRLE